jgi:hypothetical protein
MGSTLSLRLCGDKVRNCFVGDEALRRNSQLHYIETKEKSP